jgi:glycosyltransferase involved in cell wall biosynthesis
VLVGRGELIEEVRDRVRREGFSQVRVEGFIPPERVVAYYAAADFLVLPSHHEPFGAVVQEAMAAGLPVIVTSAVGAARDLVQEGKTGFVVPPGDPEALANRIAMLLKDPSLCAKMGIECLQVARRFDQHHGESEFMKAIRGAVGITRHA